ncbi:MAG: hypothetical protein JXA64_12135 [Candidatus Fermentibacteraceae bacterium]|nr:hypothetical protein [Candidatus Fermentibacteraceae bacterium]MBN2609848.1 hypothetical protein [Candidatus Fermentibacteraceae bacterium]
MSRYSRSLPESTFHSSPVHPGPGLFYGGVGEYRFGRILSAEISLGAALEWYRSGVPGVYRPVR